MKNIVILVGNAGNDPDVIDFTNGGKIARFSLATSEKFKNEAGEQIEKTEWHTVVSKNKLADLVQQYVKKGGKYYVEGKIAYRKYLNENAVEMTIAEVIAKEIKFL